MYLLDKACAGKLWDMAIKISDYIACAFLSNCIPSHISVTCGIASSAYAEIEMPKPSILDPRANRRANLFYIPVPLENLQNVLHQYHHWINNALDWIIIAKYKTFLSNGLTRWVWPDAPHISLLEAIQSSSPLTIIPHPTWHSDASNQLILHPQFNSSINKSVVVHSVAACHIPK